LHQQEANWRHHNRPETGPHRFSIKIPSLFSPSFTPFLFGRGSWSASPRSPPFRPSYGGSQKSGPFTQANQAPPNSLHRADGPAVLEELSSRHRSSLRLLLVLAGIEPHPGPVRDPCGVCGTRVAAGWLAFLCSVCDRWCHRRCARINSEAEFLRLAPWCCPTCSTPVSPARSTREPESSDLEGTLSTLSSSGSWRSAVDRLSRQGEDSEENTRLPGTSILTPPMMTNPPVAGSTLEGGRFLQFNCSRTAGLPSPSPGVGCLSTRDQTTP